MSNLISLETIETCESFSLNKVSDFVDSQRTLFEKADVEVEDTKFFDDESVNNSFNTKLKKAGIFENSNFGPFMPECVNCNDLINLKVCQILSPFSRYF